MGRFGEIRIGVRNKIKLKITGEEESKITALRHRTK
jgi:hypothetical protein